MQMALPECRPRVEMAVLSLLLMPGLLHAQGLDALAEKGQHWLEQVEQQPNKGFDHVDEGTPVAEDEDFPTSGPHWPRPAKAGFYEEPQPKGALIHALEHGLVVVYYDEPGFKALSMLRRASDDLAGRWQGLITVPHEGLGQEMVLTAWRRRLDLAEFDETALAAFIDAYSGRGPENPVR
jgi:hypothetical protein